jgi:hypothetical protein
MTEWDRPGFFTRLLYRLWRALRVEGSWRFPPDQPPTQFDHNLGWEYENRYYSRSVKGWSDRAGETREAKKGTD